MGVRILVFKATSNNISIISEGGGGVVLFVEETGVSGENRHRPVVSHCIRATTKSINYMNENRI